MERKPLVNTQTFGDLFSYDCSNEFLGGRRFFNCILLRDAYNKKMGDHVGTIYLDNPRYIVFSSGYDDEVTYPYTKKEPSLKTIQNNVHTILMNDVDIDFFIMWTSIEDVHGVCLSLRTCMFIDHYRISLRYEFEKSVKTIKHHWKRVISNPNYLMCRKRLFREFNDLQ